MNSSHSRRAKPALLHRRSVLCGLVAPGAAAVPLRAARAQPSRSAQDPALGHPRLYFTQGELPRLRALRRRKSHARIWNNLIRAAEKCLAREPRRAWIPPVSPDPRYENLYDRFYAIMGDLAITEHLAFTAALSGERRFADAGRRWVLASCRAWRREADGAPDGGKAYAVTRLLKGAAVAYDLLYDEFTAAERAEVREVLAQIGDRYFTAYFQTPTIAGPEFSTHHAIVEWASFGVLALALLGEVPAARRWLEATTQKFQEHLLPRGLAKDGAHVEGSTFWASTLQYRLFFMDALRRVTGQDLFRRFEREMSADMALASVAAEHKASMWIEHGSVVLEPGYGQLDYYAPVLAALAREYNRPLLRRLALWDRTLGGLQETRYVTPHGEQLLFCLGPYAYLWLEPEDEDSPTAAEGEAAPLAYAFPSVQEAYVRQSWRAGDLLIGTRRGQVVVHCGGQAVLVGEVAGLDTGAPGPQLETGADLARVLVGSAVGEGRLAVELDRRQGAATLQLFGVDEWSFWSHSLPRVAEGRLTWPGRARLELTAGSISRVTPGGPAPALSVGNGLLTLADPDPRSYPRVELAGNAKKQIVLRIRRHG